MTKKLDKTKFVIVFHDKSILEITKEQQEQLLDASTTNSSFIRINGQVVNFAGINKILTLGEYYKEYPDEIPEQRDMFKRETYEELSIREQWEGNKNRAEGIKKGLLKSIKEEDTPAKQAMLKDVQGAINRLE